jgi:hypothetical protein
MSQGTKVELIGMIEEVVGAEEAAEYNGLPVKALHAILAAKRAELAAKQEAAKAKAQASASTTPRAPKEPKLTKRAKAVRRLLEGDAEGQVHDLAQWFIDHVGETKPIKGSNPDFYGMKCLLRALYTRRLLSWDMMAIIRSTMEETD